jgi:hypothetical protein
MTTAAPRRVGHELNLPTVLAHPKAQHAVLLVDPKQLGEMVPRRPGLADQDFDAAKPAVGKLPINKDGKNPPVVWATCTLSGPGRKSMASRRAATSTCSDERRSFE